MPNLPPLFNQAAQLIRRGAYPQAIGLLQQAVSAQPGHFETRLQLAKACLDWVYIQSRMPLVDIKPGLLSPTAALYLHLAEARLAMLANQRSASHQVQELFSIVRLIYGRHDEALACLKKALVKEPTNPELRAQLRERLLASPICDAPRFARILEAAFRGMWREWCSKT